MTDQPDAGSPQAGYANPALLAETDWLAEHLHDANLRLIDCDTRDAFRRAHIPGAVPVRGHHYLKEKEGAPHVMGAEQFARTMGEMGIGNDTLVVAYDGFNGLYAARLWWTLAYYGHTNVKVLNGGWNAWLAEGRPVTNATTRPEPAVFTPHVQPDLIADWQRVQAAIGSERVLLDVRSDGEWTGENARGTKRGGRLPGAVHLEWLNYVDAKTSRFKPAAELRALFEEVGVSPDREVVTY